MELPSLTRDERTGYGRLERKRCPRSSLAEVSLGTSRDRLEPVFALELDRVQALLPLRHERMGESAFTFYRGSAALMSADLGSGTSSKLHVQLCGDAHAANFGVFGSPERQLVFDCNDFDETYRGPFEWDLKRLAVSLLLAAEDAGLGPADAQAVTMTALKTYAEHLREYAEMPTLQVWYARLDARAIEVHLDERRAAQVAQVSRKARRRSATRALQKFVKADSHGNPVFREDPPRLQRVPEGTHAQAMIVDYLASLPPEWADLVRRFRLRDTAFKAVGTGSVGTRCYVAVLDSGDSDDQLLLQVKEATRSVLAGHVPGPGPRHQGRRVVVGQKLMQAVGDVLLGWTKDPQSGRFYYVRQLWDMKGDLDLSRLDLSGLQGHAQLCGWALARAHARSGDPVALAAYLGKGDKFADTVLAFSLGYAEVVRQDYVAFMSALAEQPVSPAAATGKADLPAWGD